MPRWAAPIVAAVVAALLASGVVVVATMDSDDGGSPAPTSSTTTAATDRRGTTATTAGGETSITEVVPELQDFVERARGLEFMAPVDVTLLDDDEFEARFDDVEEEDLDEVRETDAVLTAMGLLDRDDDLVDIVRRFTASAVLGFYDTETKELVVRGSSPTPFVRSVLVHELTHALEDQHFGLDRDDLEDEASAGFESLAEGSAGRIEEQYRESLTSAEQREADREEQSMGANVPDVPEVVQVAIGFPYAFGPELVEAIVGAGGQARLDGAFGQPPVSSEHVLEPRSYLAGDNPKPVPVPVAGGQAFDDGEIGQLFLFLMLRSELSTSDARQASDGWGGDRYVAWRDGDRTCVRMEFVMDSAADTGQLRSALAEWADGRGDDASATGTTLVTCG